jgi:2-polyprenyl-3-methyl-5-hydroxy-6-metoxy-1,4-benzoquinol methylase
MPALIERCPNLCPDPLVPSGLVVPGGELNCCKACGQLVSACDEAQLNEGNKEWDRVEGTWPSPKDYARFQRRRKRDFDLISRIVGKPFSGMQLLDVGCSNGAVVAAAQEFGFEAEGVDTAELAILDGKKRGLNLHCGYLADIAFPDARFDAITLYEVIEHVPDSHALIAECARLLKPGGVLLLGTGNVDSWTRRIRKGRWDFLNSHVGHVNFFSPGSLKVLAPRVGLEVARVDTHSVKLKEQSETSRPMYRLVKVFSEMLNLPASLLDKGHQMEVYLRRPAVAATAHH